MPPTESTPTDPLVPWSSELADHAVEVAPRIWWVGAVLDGDPFQCHAYLIEAGESSVLVDPGSSLTMDVTLRKIQEVVPLDHVTNLLVHHSDPDCADGLHRLAEVLDHDRTRIVTEWRSEMLLRHLAPPFEFVTTEDLGWQLPLDGDRVLQFMLTPYLHFPGAFVTYEPTTGSLLTSDLFGGFNRRERLVATGVDDFDDLRSFHQHYMPSREILMAGLARLRQQFPRIVTILPQHGYVIPEQLVDPMFDELFRLECGVLLMSREDAHLSRLIDTARAVRRIEDLLEQTDALPELIERIGNELRVLLDVDELSVERRDGSTATRFDRAHPDGVEAAAAEPGPGRFLWPLGDDGHHRSLTAIIDHDADDAPVERDLLMVLGSATEHGRRAIANRLDMLDASHDVDRLRHDAQHDALTGLHNRHALSDVEPEPGTAVIMIDLDHFKRVNDTFGHEAGDAVLERTARCITEILRGPDLAFRYGGEELLVLAPMAAPTTSDRLAAATDLAERLRRSIEAIDLTDVAPELGVTASIGVALLQRSETLEAAVHRADAALYQSKATGRNRVSTASIRPPEPVR